MKILSVKESGFEQAIIGLSLSYGTNVLNAHNVSKRLAFKGVGHNKFLETMMLWVDVQAPRYWWSEADTYRIATKQSESTMHTITKRPLEQSDFMAALPLEYLSFLNSFIEKKDLLSIKKYLPEGFLQRRIWCMSYKTLQNIYIQRHNHKLPEWRYFCDEILKAIAFPEYIKSEDKGGSEE